MERWCLQGGCKVFFGRVDRIIRGFRMGSMSCVGVFIGSHKGLQGLHKQSIRINLFSSNGFLRALQRYMVLSKDWTSCLGVRKPRILLGTKLG